MSLKELAALNLSALVERLPSLTLVTLKALFEADCGCQESCRARTKQVNHAFCAYHASVYSALEVRRKNLPALEVAAAPANEAGSCCSCLNRDGEVLVIMMGAAIVRLCRPCWAELKALAVEKGDLS